MHSKDTANTALVDAQHGYSEWSRANPPETKGEAIGRGLLSGAVQYMVTAQFDPERDRRDAARKLEAAIGVRLGGESLTDAERVQVEAIQVALYSLYADGTIPPKTPQPRPEPRTAAEPSVDPYAYPYGAKASALLTVREAAAYLGRSQAFVRSLIHDGLLPSQRIRTRYYIAKHHLTDFTSNPPAEHRPRITLLPF